MQLLGGNTGKVLNESVDAHVVPMVEYEWTGPNRYAGGMDCEYEVRHATGMVTWDQPWCQPFRDLIAHPKLIPYANSLFGRGWRLDSEPFIIMARKGCGGHGLHGSLPWKADYERRSLIYRYSPKFCSYSPGIYETEMHEFLPLIDAYMIASHARKRVHQQPETRRHKLAQDNPYKKRLGSFVERRSAVLQHR